MKKSLVAVGVIIALGVVWTGSSWYVGKEVEVRMADMVQKANEELTKALPDSGLVVSYENYQRGLLDSKMQLVIKTTADAKSPLLPVGENIIFNETISHGPLPGLTHFNFIPGMASVHSELAKNETTQPLFDMTQDKSLINGVTRVAFDGATSSVISIIPVDYTKDDTHFVFSGSTMNADVDAEGDKMTFGLDANSGSIKTKNEAGQPTEISFNGINITSDSQNSVADLRVGTQKASLKSLSLNVADKELAALNGLVLSANTELQADKKNIAIQTDYSLDALKAQGHDFGSGKLAIKLDNLDAEALSAVSQAYAQESQRLLQDPDIMQDPELYRKEMVEALVASFPQLLKGNPNISVSPLSWKNSKGEATFNLALALKDPQSASAPADSVEGALGQYITNLDTRLVIPFDMAIQLMSQVAQLEGASPAEAEKLANQQVKGLAAMGQMFHITKVENNSITASLTFANDKATLNGEAIPLRDLFGSLPFSLESDEGQGEAPAVSEPQAAPGSVAPEEAPQP
ncbi:YdgA family protein [Citrobacter sp. JGM124]|uniref:YdgA family protein n=1 Tax=Citrobacter sp. JGM124 TaxID=2799789 RepID=UPI001BAD97EC|nr:YdgA family protein [Citrobacter sp. JGM124]MBS0847455.1 YdgA family protein [Citrobacter sp. JGM124]